MAYYTLTEYSYEIKPAWETNPKNVEYTHQFSSKLWPPTIRGSVACENTASGKIYYPGYLSQILDTPQNINSNISSLNSRYIFFTRLGFVAKPDVIGCLGGVEISSSVVTMDEASSIWKREYYLDFEGTPEVPEMSTQTWDTSYSQYYYGQIRIVLHLQGPSSESGDYSIGLYDSVKYDLKSVLSSQFLDSDLVGFKGNYTLRPLAAFKVNPFHTSTGLYIVPFRNTSPPGSIASWPEVTSGLPKEDPGV